MYLCISTYNQINDFIAICGVVNCFKMCIFALARTTIYDAVITEICCELLQNVYLCISTYNNKFTRLPYAGVVNCFKMCIFALARTTIIADIETEVCCELLQNVYLCISTYNLKVIFTCITASNKTFVQTKNAKQKSPITMMGLFFRIILVAVLEH